MKWEGKIVQIYDLWWRPQTQNDIEFWKEVVRFHFGSLHATSVRRFIVELCSGPGRVLVPVAAHLAERLSDLDFRAVGLDYSPEMNAALQRKVSGCRLEDRVSAREFDITEEDWEITLPSREVDVFIMPFNHFAQIGDRTLQEIVVRNVARNLRLGGLFIVDDYNPPVSRRRDTGEKVFRWMVADEKERRALYYWRRSWTLDGQHSQVLYVVECVEWPKDPHNPDKDAEERHVEILAATERIRYSTPHELDELLGEHQLKVVHRYGGYDMRRFHEADDRSQVVVARKIA
ncbi:MAG: class I SAM-dependent methyltransferase [Pseudomonadota bacterium]